MIGSDGGGGVRVGLGVRPDAVYLWVIFNDMPIASTDLGNCLLSSEYIG